MSESGGGPEIVLPPNSNYGKERTQLVPSTTVDLRRKAAARAGLTDFSVIKGAGGKITRDGKEITLPKNMAMIRDGWEGITDPEKIKAYHQHVEMLLAEKRAKPKRK